MVSGLTVIAALCGIVALSEFLVQRTALRHLGVALLVIVIAAILANVGVIPLYGPDAPVYGAIFKYLTPLAIFWLMLQVDLRRVRDAGLPMLLLFALGAAGTTAGVLVAHAVVDGAERFGDLHAALAGMFTGTYIGGAVNFNAIALEYEVMLDATLFAGAAAVDNAMTAIWMAACVALPRLLRGASTSHSDAHPTATTEDRETTSVQDLAILIALGAAAVQGSDWLATAMAQHLDANIPSVLVLTTIALVLAQVPLVQRLNGTRVLGLLAVYLFLAVIGTLCDVAAVRAIGALAPALVAFVTLAVGVHALVVFGAARALRLDPDLAAVASQANIGGSTSALALARSLGRGDLELPAILTGAVGTALGSYVGFAVARGLSVGA
ncbi:MAG: DUF819 family protein [Pseudomonadota bacterium]